MPTTIKLQAAWMTANTNPRDWALWGDNPDEFVFAGIPDIERLNVGDQQRLFDLVSRVRENLA